MIKYVLFLLLAHSGFAQTIDKDHQLLWEISGNGLKEKSYLFGSYHTNDRRVFNLTDSTYYALNKVDAIALETDVFSMFNYWDTREGSVRLQYDRNGKPYTASKKSTETVYGDEDGMPQFLDAYFQQYCHNVGKPFHPLETVDFQLNLFNDMSFEFAPERKLRSMMLTQVELMDVYLTGDIYYLDKIMKDGLGEESDYYNELITKRNFGMADKIDSILQEQTTLFTAIGAGHLAGSSGVINLLRNKGYQLRNVTASYSEVTLDKLEVKSHRYYVYENDTVGFNAEFAGKPLVEVSELWDASQLTISYRDFGQGNTYLIEVYPRDDDSSLEDLAEVYIATPSESRFEKVILNNGGEAFQGLSDSYPEGLYWTRVVLAEEYVIVLKAYGGNKFMNSDRAIRFFDNVWIH